MTVSEIADVPVLWCMHLPGPDDIFAAPDKDTAQRWADEHNAFLDRAFWEGRIEFGGDWPERHDAEVIVWPWSAESHAEDLRTNIFARKVVT